MMALTFISGHLAEHDMRAAGKWFRTRVGISALGWMDLELGLGIGCCSFVTLLVLWTPIDTFTETGTSE